MKPFIICSAYLDFPPEVRVLLGIRSLTPTLKLSHGAQLIASASGKYGWVHNEWWISRQSVVPEQDSSLRVISIWNNKRPSIVMLGYIDSAVDDRLFVPIIHRSDGSSSIATALMRYSSAGVNAQGDHAGHVLFMWMGCDQYYALDVRTRTAQGFPATPAIRKYLIQSATLCATP